MTPFETRSMRHKIAVKDNFRGRSSVVFEFALYVLG